MRSLKFVVMLVLGACFVSSAVFAAGTSLGTAIRAQIPYFEVWEKGGDAFAKSVGLEQVVQNCSGRSEKQLYDIKALVAKTGGNVVFCIAPNGSQAVVPIAKFLEEAGVYFVTFWNKPDEVKVWDYPHWVSHITVDSVQGGYLIAKELFKTFKTPNKGKIIALQGELDDIPAVERFQGLQKALAEFSDVKLVQEAVAHSNRTEGYYATKSMLAVYPDIDGVWTANDEMALGALEALRAKGLAGKVKVVGVDGIEEMIRAIDKGEAAATFYPDPFWQGGMGLSIVLAAKEGKIDVNALPKEKRQWYATGLVVSAENVKDFIKTNLEGTPAYDWSDYFGHWLRGMP